MKFIAKDDEGNKYCESYLFHWTSIPTDVKLKEIKLQGSDGKQRWEYRFKGASGWILSREAIATPAGMSDEAIILDAIYKDKNIVQEIRVTKLGRISFGTAPIAEFMKLVNSDRISLEALREGL